MKNLYLLFTVMALAAMVNTLQAQPLCIWDYESGLSGVSLDVAALPNSNAFGGGVTPGGIQQTPNGMLGLAASDWPLNSTPDGYYQAQVFCPAGNCDLTGFSAVVESSVEGPTSVLLEYSTQTAFANPISLGTFAVSIGSQTSINVPVFSPGNTRITLRMYPTNASSTFGLSSFYVDEFIVNGSASVPLPAELVSFEVDRISDASVAVKWSTASELNVRQFKIEQSYEGKNFETVGYSTPKGLATRSADYQMLLDVKPSLNHYFRLVTEDLDGSLELSDIVFTPSLISQKDAVRLIANHAGTLTFSASSPHKLRIISASGQVVVDQVLPQGEHTINELKSHPPGIYIASWGNGSLKIFNGH